MTGEPPPTLNRFEDRLLHHLHDALPMYPAPQSAPRGRRRLLIGVGALASAGVAALISALMVSTAAPAYAIHARPDGSFVVVIDSTTEKDLSAAERDLRARGARIELVAKTLDCLDVLRAPDPSAPVEPHGPLPDGPPPPGMFPWFDAFHAVEGIGNERRNPATGEPLESHEFAFTVRPSAIAAGQVLWVAVNGPGIPGSGLVTVAGFAAEGAGPPQLCST
jgi:hypothetical protein